MDIDSNLSLEKEVVTPEVADTPEPSLREQIESSHKEISARDRDEAGRFAAKKVEEAPAKPADAADDLRARLKAKEAPVEAPAASETPERPTLAPNAWSHQAKAAFANADPAIKAEIAKREADIHKEFTRQDEQRNFGRAVQQVVAPYAQLIQQEGGNPVKAFQGYLETTRILRQGDPQTKARLVQQMCQTFGIDLAAVSGGQAGENIQNPVAPELTAYQNRIANLEAQVAGFGKYAETQALAPLQAQIEAFGSDPKNAHFEAVKPEMAALLSGGRANSLQDAYDMAVWARPDIRSSLIAQQTAAGEAKRVADARAKADAARRAGGSITGSPGMGTSTDPKAGNRSLREELEASMSSARI